MRGLSTSKAGPRRSNSTACQQAAELQRLVATYGSRQRLQLTDLSLARTRRSLDATPLRRDRGRRQRRAGSGSNRRALTAERQPATTVLHLRCVASIRGAIRRGRLRSRGRQARRRSQVGNASPHAAEHPATTVLHPRRGGPVRGDRLHKEVPRSRAGSASSRRAELGEWRLAIATPHPHRQDSIRRDPLRRRGRRSQAGPGSASKALLAALTRARDPAPGRVLLRALPAARGTRATAARAGLRCK